MWIIEKIYRMVEHSSFYIQNRDKSSRYDKWQLEMIEPVIEDLILGQDIGEMVLRQFEDICDR